MTMTVLYFVFAFIVTVGILVVVHEYGHYIVARLLGVRTLTFSVGFGNVIWSKQFGENGTRFCLSAVPLGGYVDMLDTRKDDVSPAEEAVAFDKQRLWKRSLIVLAGPFFNFAFAILAFALMYMLGVADIKAFVGEVQPKTPAALAGIQSGYQITAVNGESAVGWQAVIEKTLPTLLNSHNKTITYTVITPNGQQYDTLVNLTGISIDDLRERAFFEKIGFMPLRPTLEPIIGEIVSNSAAERAGLQAGDKILSLEGDATTNWSIWAEKIAANPNTPMIVEIERDNTQLTLTVTPEEREGRGFIGVALHVPEDFADKYYGIERYGFFAALGKGVTDTWQMITLTLHALYKMVTLQISHRNINGPLTIGEAAGQSMELGVERFLKFLAIVSLSLGIINLLPIPPLDGGHLLMYSMEALKGGPVADSVELTLQKIGFILVICLMGLAFFNDFERLFLQ